MNATNGYVYIVDDDDALREGLDSLFRSVGYNVATFASARAFVATEGIVRPSCLVLDVRMPGMNGLELQAELARRRLTISMVMLTGHGDVPMCSTAMKAGAVDFLLKPFREQDLLDAVAVGMDRDGRAHTAELELIELEQRFATLTPRERAVMAMVVEGHLNKVIAARFELSEITIKLSRGQVMRKMGATSLPALVRVADQLRKQQLPGQ